MMNTETKELLEKVVTQRLNEALECDVESEEGKRAFKEAMEAISKCIELEKIESAEEAQLYNRDLERMKVESAEEAKDKDRELEREKIEMSKKEQNQNKWIKFIEVAAIPVGITLLNFALNRYYIRTICNFEKDYTFTTSPGKGISGLFRFKR